MTMQERDRIRKLQDTLIKLAEGRNYEDSMRVSVDMPDNVTLATLRTFIYPEYEAEIRTVIQRLKAR